MDQNLNLYKIFYETANQGAISKAAEALYISQPAVSKSVSRLEEMLGHTLFIRSKKGVRLTAEGEILYSHLQQAFQSIETAERTLKRMDAFGMGQLRIGVSTSLCNHILLSYLQDFIIGHPHVKISIECNPTFETLSLLRQNKLDIGLICETPLDKGLQFAPLHTIHDTFVATQTYLDNLFLREGQLSSLPRQHSLLPVSLDRSKHIGHQDGIPDSHTDSTGASTIQNLSGVLLFSETANLHPNDGISDPSFDFSEKEILEKSNLMLLDRDNISRIFINEYFSKYQIQPRQILEINNMDLLIDFAAIGMGVACVVREFVSSYLDSGQVIEIPLEYPIPERVVGLVYPRQGMSPSTKKFLDVCL